VAADGKGIALELAARLKPGFSPQQAEAECRTIWYSTMKEYYRDVEGRSEDEASQLVSRGVFLDSLERGVSILRDSFGAVLKIVMAATALLLVVACLNIGGVLLTRAVARQHEMAVQLALGASPFMLVRQTLAEGLLLGVLGGASGVSYERREGDTWSEESAVNGSSDQPPRRLSRLNPAIRAIRSSSAGQT